MFAGCVRAISVCLVLASAAGGQAPPEDDGQVAARRLEYMLQAAAEYEVERTSAPAPLPLHPEPLLRFNNAVSGVPDGIVVMWKHGARPAVFGQVFQTKDGLWIQECQSLAGAPLVMRRAGQVLWQPQTAAEEFRPLEGAAAPAEKAVGRLVQMRALAREFSAADDFKISSSDAEPTRHELRLLPNPIYRYEDESTAVRDGAVFAFVHGTDPEVFLVLEVRAADGNATWHYTLAPMTCWAVYVKHQGEPDWSVAERLGKSSREGLYHVWVHARGESP